MIEVVYIFADERYNMPFSFPLSMPLERLACRVGCNLGRFGPVLAIEILRVTR